ncbi:GntR family transcriptional regulator [Paraferrimonas sedimenticola]|uniref:GntR family transcriptional regulator n=1 Tax=Paraferrimonas sedimenticola TaxID=375674 RepID=A0AA37RW36_9GAMM|nr:GntR family transcriptional regulator [Paraferrimonas sedimenticola]GLP96420.1 GntR family transcriptional regulator [Paraferrimonas sedimenticola]
MNITDVMTDPRLKSALNHDIPTPLYHQVYLFLKEKIQLGDIEHGEKMPTEHQISEAFGVSRITAKRAMDELSEEGYIRRQRGIGSHVTYQHRKEKVQAPLSGMLESLQIMGQETQVKSLMFAKKVPPLDIQKRFDLKEGESLYWSVRVRESDGEPFGYYVSWTREIGDDYNEENILKHTRLKLFRRMGINLDKVEQTLTATLSNVDTGLQLNIPAGKPLLVLDRSMYDESGVLIDHLYALYRPDKYQFEMEFSMR